jgi:DNA adenine methylase
MNLSKNELLNKCKELNVKVSKSKTKSQIIQLINETHGETNEHSVQIIPKPILKWVGGKTQILQILFDNFPTEMNNYHEIFLGGGSVLISLLHHVKLGKIHVDGNIHAYDSNETLIHVYKNIQTHPTQLYENLTNLINELNTCGNSTEINRTPKNIDEAKLSKENYYYWIRHEYNCLSNNDKLTPYGSAIFIFLNKTCFRGLFRLGPNGFNVPYGHYTNPEIINEVHLNEIHELIQGVIFQCSDFEYSLVSATTNDFVYLDPPYAPENETSFVKYTETGFDINNHNKLFKLIDDSPAKIMMSNSNVGLVQTNFESEKYNKIEIMCKRSINSKNPEAKTSELIIKNY